MHFKQNLFFIFFFEKKSGKWPGPDLPPPSVEFSILFFLRVPLLFWQEHFSSPFHPDGDWWCYDILLMTWHSKIDILQLPGHYWCPSPVLLCSAIYDQSVANTHHSQARFLQVLWFPRHLHNMRGLESGLCFRLGCCEFSRDSSTKLHTSIRVSKVIWLCCVECSVKVYTFNITSIEVLNEEKWI